MNILRALRITIAPLALALPLLLPATVQANGNSGNHSDMTPCHRTANNMHKACQFDSKDGLNEAIAICRNVSDRDERRECISDARAERVEAVDFCGQQLDARVSACYVLNENRYDPDPLLDPTITFIHPDQVPDSYLPNPYVSVQAGHTFLLQSDDGTEIVVVTVTEEVRDILGVACRVVIDIVFDVSSDGGETEYELVEYTDDWFAQSITGDVFYCGEIARNYEDGILRDLDGSFEAGLNSAKSGYLIKAFPTVDDAHRTEFALGEAEDIIKYLSTASGPSESEGGDNPNFPCNEDQCLRTFDFAPLAPESTEFKYYLPGTGFVLAVGMHDGVLTGEREELVCVGDSLEVLESGCGLEDPAALIDELCRLSPDAFCAD